MIPFSLVITFGTQGNFVTRDFKFDTMPTNAELQQKLGDFFAPLGLAPIQNHTVPHKCALLTRKPPYEYSKPHGTD